MSSWGVVRSVFFLSSLGQFCFSFKFLMCVSIPWSWLLMAWAALVIVIASELLSYYSSIYLWSKYPLCFWKFDLLQRQGGEWGYWGVGKIIGDSRRDSLAESKKDPHRGEKKTYKSAPGKLTFVSFGNCARNPRFWCPYIKEGWAEESRDGYRIYQNVTE